MLSTETRNQGKKNGSIFSWIEILIFHRLHILGFQMLSTETRNQGKKVGSFRICRWDLM